MVIGDLIPIRVDPHPHFERVVSTQIEFARLELSCHSRPADRVLATLPAIVLVVHEYAPAQPELSGVTRRFSDLGLPLRSPVPPVTKAAAQIERFECSGPLSRFIKR